MIIERLLNAIQPGRILNIQVGMSRTAVVAETQSGIHCGLAATFSNPDCDHRKFPSVAKAGCLLDLPSDELSALVNSESLTEVTIGLAAINALLPDELKQRQTLNGREYLLSHAAGKDVAMIGHFPFIEMLRPLTRNLWTLELRPRPGDLPADQAPFYLPQADIVAITATTIINRTFDGLIPLCRPGATVVLLGPSTPLSPVLFDMGITVISGTHVLNVAETLTGIAQGSSIHQLKERGMVEYVVAEAGG